MSLYQSQNQLVTRILFLLQSSCSQLCGEKIFLQNVKTAQRADIEMHSYTPGNLMCD